MAEQALKIILVEEQNPQHASAASSAASSQTGPTQTASSGPPASGTTTSPKPSPSQPQSQHPAGPSTRDAAVTFARTLAEQSGMGGLVKQVDNMVAVVNRFNALVNAAYGTRQATSRSAASQVSQTVQNVATNAASQSGGNGTASTLAGAAASAVTSGASAGASSGSAAAGGAAASGAGGTAGASAGGGALAVLSNPITIAVAVVAAALVGAGLAVKKFADIIGDQAKKLDAYSPQVSQAVGETEMRQERAMLRRGQEIGPDVAKWERLRGRAEEAFTDLGTEILKALMSIFDAFEPLLKDAVVGIKIVAAAVEPLGKFIETVLDFLTGDWAELMADAGEIPELLRRMSKKISDAIDEAKRDDDAPMHDPFMDEFLALGSALGGPVGRAPGRGGGMRP